MAIKLTIGYFCNSTLCSSTLAEQRGKAWPRKAWPQDLPVTLAAHQLPSFFGSDYVHGLKLAGKDFSTEIEDSTNPNWKVNQREATCPPRPSRGRSSVSSCLPTFLGKSHKQLYKKKKRWRRKGHAGPLLCSHTTLHKQCQCFSASVQRLRDRSEGLFSLKHWDWQVGGPQILVLRPQQRLGHLPWCHC